MNYYSHKIFKKNLVKKESKAHSARIQSLVAKKFVQNFIQSIEIF
jgi:hypothetical protein